MTLREVVHTATGRLRGIACGPGVLAWKGIPYARPPVGDLRWRAPQPMPPWRGVRDARDFGPAPMQEPFPGDAAPPSTRYDEACLTLNVWAPTTPGPHPVMVWFYGGGFANGGSSPAVYDGGALAGRGVVLVSFNYRVGRLGFFSHPALLRANADEGWYGNYGLMDQIAALHWVQQHIHDFGCDATRITLFGESAGATSIAYLMGSSAAQGRFQQAILQSGNLRTVPAGLEQTTEAGMQFVATLGIKGQDEAVLRQLRALPAPRLVAGLHLGNMGRQGFGGPMIDGRLITEPIMDAWSAGRQARVPLIVGANDDELGFFSPTLGRDAATQRGDTVFAEPARYAARCAHAAGQPVWAYRFGQVAQSMRAPGRSAWHATEIPFIFGTLAARYGNGVDNTDHACSQYIGDAWVAFARNGAPASQADWQRYDHVRKTTLQSFPPDKPPTA